VSGREGSRGERNYSEFGDVGSRIEKRDREVGSRGQDPSQGQGGVELGSCRRAEQLCVLRVA